MYTQLGVMTKGTVIEVNVSELGMVTTGGKVVFGKYAQITNNPENDGCINAVLRALFISCPAAHFRSCVPLFSGITHVHVHVHVHDLQAVYLVCTGSTPLHSLHILCYSIRCFPSYMDPHIAGLGLWNIFRYFPDPEYGT